MLLRKHLNQVIGDVVRKIICVLFLIFLLGFASADVYIFKAEKTFDDVSIEELILKEGEAPNKKEKSENSYSAAIISSENEILYETAFEFPESLNILYVDIPSEKIPMDESFRFVVLPYFENGEKIIIKDPQGRVVTSEDISQYAEIEPPAQPYSIIEIIAFIGAIMVAAGMLVYLKSKQK